MKNRKNRKKEIKQGKIKYEINIVGKNVTNREKMEKIEYMI